MSVERHRFDVNTDTGVWTDTGVSFHGAIQQMRWNAATGDTGADLQISLINQTGGDTGDNMVIYEDNDCLGTDFTKVPMQPAHASDGTDTGVDQYALIVGAGERMRVKVTPGGAAVVGTLYIWTYAG